MSEYTPPWRKVRMTKSQIKKYIKNLEEKRKIAQKKLEQAKKSWEWQKEEQDVKELEDLLEDL